MYVIRNMKWIVTAAVCYSLLMLWIIYIRWGLSDLMPWIRTDRLLFLFVSQVAQLSPSVLIAEGIPVFRCLQYPFEYVVTFPGAYHSKFSCGFNCSEAVCFAPIDWLPHGQNIIEHYAGYGFKTLLSHDKLLLGAAKEAVTYLWDSLTNKSSNSKIHFWRSACGADGTFTRLVKVCLDLNDY